MILLIVFVALLWADYKRTDYEIRQVTVLALLFGFLEALAELTWLLTP